ncbi:MAG: PDZ domain-containing protein [Planctomycetota bacterium]
MRTAIALLALSAVCLAEEAKAPGATLGIETRQPTKQEGSDFRLGAIAGRWCGRLVTSVEEGGPASKAGAAVGDVLVRVGANDLYSQDDLDDVLRWAKAGAEVTLVVKRAGTNAEESLAATLGGSAAAGDGLTWHFAGPGQLEDALALAKKEGKTVLVGLSGAET